MGEDEFFLVYSFLSAIESGVESGLTAVSFVTIKVGVPMCPDL